MQNKERGLVLCPQIVAYIHLSGHGLSHGTEDESSCLTGREAFDITTECQMPPDRDTSTNCSIDGRLASAWIDAVPSYAWRSQEAVLSSLPPAAGQNGVPL